MGLDTKAYLALGAATCSMLALTGLGPAAAATPTDAFGAQSGQTNTSSRIVGGAPAGSTTAPWFALLKLQTDGGTSTICGGTIISERWIVTAAHCLRNVSTDDEWLRSASPKRGAARDLIVVKKKGSYALVNPTNISGNGSPKYGIAKIVSRPDYRSSGVIRNDLALIKTKKPMKAKTLPYSSGLLTAAGTSLMTLGFGVTNVNSQTPSPVLRVAGVTDLAGLDVDACGWFGNNTVVSNGVPLGYLVDMRTQICAGTIAQGTDSCQGDSGGPLATVSARPALVGVVAWGPGCGGGEHWPGVYTRVSAYWQWIKNITKVAPNIKSHKT